MTIMERIRKGANVRNLRNSIRFSLSIAATLAVATACSGNKFGKSPTSTHGADDQHVAIHTGVDINASDVSPQGCLDLQLLTQKFSTLPEGTVVRQYTRSLKMESTSVDGKQLTRARNMLAETALANYSFSETQSSTFANELLQVEQQGCSSVDITDAIAGKVHYEIMPDSRATFLHLKIPPAPAPTPSAENPNPKVVDIGREELITLKSARELETTSISPHVDRCPSFMKVQVTVVREKIWGNAAEIAGRPPEITTALLKNIAVAVREMPTGMTNLLAEANSDTIAPDIQDLLSLKHATLDPQIARCPFDSTPPSADEPPPPEEDVPHVTPPATHVAPPTPPVPAPTPEPSPAPQPVVPTPAPVPAPSPFN